ncbi:MAG TPA: IPT/TIG domain-containing protein, partial [Thermoanaerobaculia bacterium]
VRTLGRDLRNPEGVAVDPRSGIVYVSDTKAHQIRIILPNGATSVLAGSGVPGLADGSGRNAQFKEPKGVALDVAQNALYVADSANHSIRRVTLSGAVTTVAGSGRPGLKDGRAAGAEFKEPSALALDSAGALYVADTKNNVIRRVTNDGSTVTFAGTGRDGFADGAVQAARFAEPEGIVVSPSGVLFIADTRNQRIRRIENGTVATVAGTGSSGYSGDGPAVAARFAFPTGLTFDDSGNLIIADSGNDVIRALASDGMLTTVAGRLTTNSSKQLIDGRALAAQFSGPRGLAFAGALYAADTGNDAVRVARVALQLASIAPQRGPTAGGTELRLFGAGFVAGETGVSIGGLAATELVHVSAGELRAKTPVHAAGEVDVVVSTSSDTAILPSAYSYVAPPTLAAVSPAKGRTVGGEVVTITGSGFDETTSFFFGGAAAINTIVIDSISASVKTPAGIHGTVDVIARNDGGEARLREAFRYWAQPVIAGFTPATGVSGTLVTVTGSAFDPEVSGNLVRFGAVPSVVLSATETSLVTTVPTGATNGPIFITTAGGNAFSSTAFVVPVMTAMTIDPAAAEIEPGETQQFTARATWSDGRTVDVTTAVSWSSSNGQIATIAAGGLAHGIDSGSATIEAVLNGTAATATLTIRSSEPLPPDPATVAPPVDRTIAEPFHDTISFLYSGANAIQTGVAAGAVEARRAAVVRGRVLTSSGSPLGGAKVSIVGHPELGQTLSRADGGYDLAVNGGGQLTVRYEKSGYLAIERQPRVHWNDFKVIGDVALTPLDAAVTTIALSAPAVQSARGGRVTDKDGTRRATVIFPAGTTATMVMPDGSLQPLAAMNVRATEYTVGSNGPKAMPAELPPTSAYTYCVELSADEALAAGAAEVRFNKPVA